MILISTNIIQDMILNNIQKVLVVDQAPCVMLNANVGTVTFEPYNSRST